VIHKGVILFAFNGGNFVQSKEIGTPVDVLSHNLPLTGKTSMICIIVVCQYHRLFAKSKKSVAGRKQCISPSQRFNLSGSEGSLRPIWW
jgi:hypothetical protein